MNMYEKIDMILLDMEAEGLLTVTEDMVFEPTKKGKPVWREEFTKRCAHFAEITILEN